MLKTNLIDAKTEMIDERLQKKKKRGRPQTAEAQMKSFYILFKLGKSAEFTEFKRV